MKTTDLQYELPAELIAQTPALRRDASRLMVVDRAAGTISHESFDRLPQLLPPRSLLVMNDTKVLPARLEMRRRSGGAVQGLFIRESPPGTWEMMVTAGRRLKPGELLVVQAPGSRHTQDGETFTARSASEGQSEFEQAQASDSGQCIRLLERTGEGTWRAEPVPPGPAEVILARVGLSPLPPYIHRQRGPEAMSAPQRGCDLERYQTIYARQPGAVAAPTAGLHFSPAVMEGLSENGISMAFVTLHVGVGTFAPIRVEHLAEHRMHSEWYECPAATAEAVNAARQDGRPIIAVGTTSVRVLETSADGRGHVSGGSGWTDIFIYPPYRYRAIDGLITNFHLPGITLLALVFAFAGSQLVSRAYEEAIAARYRFFSYGDAMLIKNRQE